MTEDDPADLAREDLVADLDRRLASGAYDDELSAAREGRRIRKLSSGIRAKMQCLAIWCESGKCRVGRVFVTKQRLLLEVSSPEDTDWNGKGVGRGYVAYWVDAKRPRIIAFTCDCRSAQSRWIEKDRLRSALADESARNVSVKLLLRESSA